MAEQSDKKPLVSCIMIFLNAGTIFFVEAIESIFAQTYDNWELILVDDGSTDESTAIALKCAEKYPDKVHYLDHEGHQNRGMSATRNLGIAHSRGEYIAFLDADDIWLPQKLEKQVAILNSEPEAAMVYGSTLMWYSWTGNPEDNNRDFGRTLGVEPNTLVKPPTLLKLFLQGKAHTPGTCAVLMRRELIKSISGFEESFRGMFEDQAFFYKICLNLPVFIESGCWDKYRQHSSSACHIAAVQKDYSQLVPNPDKLKFLNWFYQYLSQQNVTNFQIQQELNHALWDCKNPRARIYLDRLDRLLDKFRYPIRSIKNLYKKTIKKYVNAFTS